MAGGNEQLQEVIQGSRDHGFCNGLAVIVGCPYSCKETHRFLPGVEKDSCKGDKIFRDLMFYSHYLYDKSVHEVKGIIQALSELPQSALPESWRRIVVIFCGHGESGDVLYTRDGTLSLRQDVIEPILNAQGLARLAKLLFIDACRGSSEDPGVDISWLSGARGDGEGAGSDGDGTGRNRVPSRGNYLICCSAQPGMQSYETSEGGYWMQLLLDELTNSEDHVLAIMPEVNRKLREFCNQQHRPLMQPVLESTLRGSVRLLCEAGVLNRQHSELDENAKRVLRKLPYVDGTTELTLKDLPYLRMAIIKIASRWHSLGIHFTIPPDLLDKFSRESRNVSDQSSYCLTCVLVEWLNNWNDRYGPPTWRLVVIAVASRVGGDNPRVAENIGKECMSYRSAISFKNSNMVDNTPLNNSPETLTGIVALLDPVATHWDSIGIFLGIPYEDIQRWRLEHSIVDRLTRMVEGWLERKHDVEEFGEPTWRLLVEAVATMSGGNNQRLAAKIAKKHPRRNE